MLTKEWEAGAPKPENEPVPTPGSRDNYPFLFATRDAGRTALCPEMSVAPAAVPNQWVWRVGPLSVRLDHASLADAIYGEQIFLAGLDIRYGWRFEAKSKHEPAVKATPFRDLARIIHGFWKSCAEVASFAKRFQFDCQMLNFVQSATTEVADLVIERGKNAFLENSSALVCCDFLELGLG